ncbi:MAG TPA: hypothetical protein ENH82_11135 [bacterium]|nr:hypothetical protein [bacterium]
MDSKIAGTSRVIDDIGSHWFDLIQFVTGTEKSIWWDHERPNELMIGNRNNPNELILKDAVLIDVAHPC